MPGQPNVDKETLLKSLEITFVAGFFQIDTLGKLMHTNKTISAMIKESKGWKAIF